MILNNLCFFVFSLCAMSFIMMASYGIHAVYYKLILMFGEKVRAVIGSAILLFIFLLPQNRFQI